MSINHKKYLLLFGLILMISACKENSTSVNDTQTLILNVVHDIQLNSFENEKQISNIKDNESASSNKTEQTIQVNNQKFTAKYLAENYPNNLYEIYDYDVNTDGIKDKIFSSKNDENNTYQGDDLIVYLRNPDKLYRLSLETTNYTDETGWFLTDIYPRENHSGFILKTHYSPRGNSNQFYYFDKIDNEWMLSKYVSEGTLITGEDYYCVENNNFNLSEFEYGESANFTEKQFQEKCSPLPLEYRVIVEKAEILTDNFESRSPPNYYIKGDTIEAFDQNEDWVKVAYKNGTKFGWVAKRNLKSIPN